MRHVVTRNAEFATLLDALCKARIEIEKAKKRRRESEHDRPVERNSSGYDQESAAQ